MSKADDIFVAMCSDIIEHGTTTEGQRVRPHWEDGSPAYTIKRFGVCNRYDLRENPYSRRIMTNLYTFADLSEMNLYPCAFNAIYNVTQEPGDDRPTLNMLLVQRSQDVLAANNWNVCQYAILLMMVAQVSGMNAGELVHMIADAHIYDRHVDVVRELISRPTHPAPTVRLNPEVTDFYDFTTDDLIVENYEHGPQVKNIPIAV